MKVNLYRISITLYQCSVLTEFAEEGWSARNEQAWDALCAKAEALGLTEAMVQRPEQEGYSGYRDIFPRSDDIWTDGPHALDILSAFPEARITRTSTVEVDPGKVFECVSSKAEAACVGGHAVYNTKCDVHMPGHMLATYNEIQLLEDACSDSLQESLNKGWRILAACPQPDQRRPDYILGRYNPDPSLNGGADRGRN